MNIEERMNKEKTKEDQTESKAGSAASDIQMKQQPTSANDDAKKLDWQMFATEQQDQKMQNRGKDPSVNSSFDSQVDNKDVNAIQMQNEEQQAAMEESKEPKPRSKKRAKEMITRDTGGSENTAGSLFVCQACDKTFATKNKKKQHMKTEDHKARYTIYQAVSIRQKEKQAAKELHYYINRNIEEC